MAKTGNLLHLVRNRESNTRCSRYFVKRNSSLFLFIFIFLLFFLYPSLYHLSFYPNFIILLSYLQFCFKKKESSFLSFLRIIVMFNFFFLSLAYCFITLPSPSIGDGRYFHAGPASQVLLYSFQLTYQNYSASFLSMERRC